MAGKTSGLVAPSGVLPSYTRNMTRVADISSIFPSEINEELRRGFACFGKRLPGFDSHDSLLTAVESRTSAPIRILRNAQFFAEGHDLVFPCGEGAGYAGGITSAAVDGVRTALAIIRGYKPHK